MLPIFQKEANYDVILMGEILCWIRNKNSLVYYCHNVTESALQTVWYYLRGFCRDSSTVKQISWCYKWWKISMSKLLLIDFIENFESIDRNQLFGVSEFWGMPRQMIKPMGTTINDNNAKLCS